MGNTYKVTFQPAGKEAIVPAGTLLLDAAVAAGVFLETPCGGQGRCGRCLVKVEKGEVTRQENPHLTPKQLQEGWVLSCVARVGGDLLLTVPAQKEREKIVLETAASRAAVPVRCDWPRFLTVRQVYVEIPHPSLEDNAPDQERLRRVLAAQHNIDSLYIGLPLLKKLAATLREAKWQITVTLDVQDKDGARLIDLHPGQRRGPLLGAAVDIGTTNVVVDLVDLRNGRVISRVSALNKQIARGEDVISRIIYSERGKGLEELRLRVVETINELLAELAKKHNFATQDVQTMVVAGNTIMTHLFLGLPSKHLREEPYVPTATSFPLVLASEAGIAINPNAYIYCLPAVAAYVGGDITAGVLSSCLFKSDKLTLFLDVGTNGEMVLGNADWMTTCACSAGPAFEGAGVRNGMRATRGAIEEVRINSRTLEPTLRVIGDVHPQGICGSGMISALAEMLVTGVVNRSGRIDQSYVNEIMKEKSRVRRGDHGAEYILAWAKDSGTKEDIVLTEVDINNLIRTKAAIYAGIAVMARNVGIPLSQVEEVLIGGAFGQHINVEAAITIGLLPDLPWEKVKFLGNTSAWGAYNVLLSKYARAQVEEIAHKMTYLELIADNSFMDELTGALFLPHTDIDRFPSIKALLEASSRK